MKIAALALLAGLALAETPSGQVTIQSSSYSGNGCPQGSVSSIISPDRTVITFGFDQFQAFIGPRAAQGDKQKNCQIHLDLRYPGGYQMSIMQATYHGYVRLDAGVTGSFYSTYFFSQAANKISVSRADLSGPDYLRGKVYEKTDNVENNSLVWSPCGANGILNVNNRIALSSRNANGEGEISTDDATIKFTQKLHVQWRRCSGRGRVRAAEVDLGSMNSTLAVVA